VAALRSDERAVCAGVSAGDAACVVVARSFQLPAKSDTVTARGPLKDEPMTDQQADDLIAEAKKAAVAIEAYVVMNGPEHDEDCPADDTCDCEMKWINDAMNAAPKLLAALVERVTRPPQEVVGQVTAEMRHLGRLLRSRDVQPTPETMADRLFEWSSELQPSAAEGQQEAPKEPIIGGIPRVLELLAEFGISETDTLKHTLEDHQRWREHLRADSPQQEQEQAEVERLRSALRVIGMFFCEKRELTGIPHGPEDNFCASCYAREKARTPDPPVLTPQRRRAERRTKSMKI
jgi:hypothetical protein